MFKFEESIVGSCKKTASQAFIGLVLGFLLFFLRYSPPINSK